MSRIFRKPFEEVVRSRSSIRTFNHKPLSNEVKGKIEQYIQGLTNPFSGQVSFKFLQSSVAANAKKLGTYGMIEGAVDYVGVTVLGSELAYEAVGYEFEKLILYAASIGVGTCWLGGTFSKGEFAKAMGIKEDEIFPAISPLGIAANRRATESLVRMTVKADQRKPWAELFFNKSFSSVLTEADAGAYEFALEMVRLAPSASNKQPWRIVQDGNSFHFYEAKKKGYSDRLGFDIQRVDMGIAACHFHLAATERGLNGLFQNKEKPNIDSYEDVDYAFSWEEI